MLLPEILLEPLGHRPPPSRVLKQLVPDVRNGARIVVKHPDPVGIMQLTRK